MQQSPPCLFPTFLQLELFQDNFWKHFSVNSYGHSSDELYGKVFVFYLWISSILNIIYPKYQAFVHPVGSQHLWQQLRGYETQSLLTYK